MSDQRKPMNVALLQAAIEQRDEARGIIDDLRAILTPAIEAAKKMRENCENFAELVGPDLSNICQLAIETDMYREESVKALLEAARILGVE